MDQYFRDIVGSHPDWSACLASLPTARWVWMSGVAAEDDGTLLTFSSGFIVLAAPIAATNAMNIVAELDRRRGRRTRSKMMQPFSGRGRNRQAGSFPRHYWTTSRGRGMRLAQRTDQPLHPDASRRTEIAAARRMALRSSRTSIACQTACDTLIRSSTSIRAAADNHCADRGLDCGDPLCRLRHP